MWRFAAGGDGAWKNYFTPQPTPERRQAKYTCAQSSHFWLKPKCNKKGSQRSFLANAERLRQRHVIPAGNKQAHTNVNIHTLSN